MNMFESMYEAVYEKLNEKVESGELTLEDAQRLNQFAYDKYMAEAEEASKEEELVQCLLQKVQDGYKLPKKLKECLEDCCKEDEGSDDKEAKEDDTAPTEADADEPQE